MISFLLSPVGRFSVLLIAFLGWTAYQRHDAAQEALQGCRADELRRELETTQYQLRAASQLSFEARQRALKSQSDMEALRTERDAILATAKGSCQPFDPATRERLRRLYNGSTQRAAP
jgi:hypothetical protein